MDTRIYTSELIEVNGMLQSKMKSEISYPESGNYDYFQIEANSFWFKHRNNCIIEAVKKYSPGDIFFDVGGGNGYVARGLEDSGITTVLLEPGSQGCLNAKKRGLKNIICSTIHDAKFRSNSIPSMGLFDVVEHIEDDTAFLRDIFASLKVDGHLFVTVPAYQNLWSFEDVEAGHYRRYTLDELIAKLRNIGFKIEYSTYIFSILPLPVFLFRTLPSKLGFSNNNSNRMATHKKQHAKGNKIISSLIDKVWSAELEKVKKGKKISFGGSCFLVAKK